MLREQQIEGVGRRRAEGEGDPGGGDTAALADVDDQRQPDEREGEREPDAAAHAFVEDVARPERDDQRRDVLDQERDPDREPVNREEVEPLHQGEAADPPDGEKRELAPADLEAPGCDREQRDHEADDRPCHPHLRQPERRDSRCQDDLRDGSVHRPQGGRARRHQVADARAAVRGRRNGEWGFGHPL